MMSIAEISGAGGGPLALSEDEVAVPVEWRVPQWHDHEDFMRLCEPEERARLRALGSVFWEMSLAKSLAEGAALAAGRRKHLAHGWSAKTLLGLHRLWVHGGYKLGDWHRRGPCFAPRDFRALMRAYKGAQVGLPEEFRQYLARSFAEWRGRDDMVKAWYRHFIHEVWLADQPVPGYGRASDWYATRARVMPHGLLVRTGDLPDGWSEDNLRRQLPKRRAVRAQLAHGYLAAHTHQPDQFLGDRGQLRPFERVFADDVRPDLRTLWLDGGKGEIVYPLVVLLLDACSGVDLANVAKPRALKEDGTRHGVSRDMMRLALVALLRRWGRPPWPITVVHENAAACLTREDLALFRDAFGDSIRFESTPIFRERMTRHGFIESGGCPWAKGPIEAFFRILQTQLALLRSSTGPRYDEQHGELKAIEDYTLALVDAAKGAREVIDLLRTPLPRFEAAHDAIERALRLLRFRTRHQLQGFARVAEAQLPDGRWIAEAALAALPPEAQAQVKIISRLESPAERFARGLQGVSFEPIDPDLLTWIEARRFRVTVRAGKITTGEGGLASERLVFREEGHTLLEPEREGRTYEAAMASDGSRLVLAENGRLVGTVARQGRVDVTDRAAVEAEKIRVHRARMADREHLRGYLATQDDSDRQMRAHNAAVLAAAPEITAAAEAQRLAEPEKPTVAEHRKRGKRARQFAALALAKSQPAEI